MLRSDSNQREIDINHEETVNLTEVTNAILLETIQTINQLSNQGITLSINEVLDCISSNRKTRDDIIKKLIENNHHDTVKTYLTIVLNAFIKQFPSDDFAYSVLSCYRYEIHCHDLARQKESDWHVMNLNGHSQYHVNMIDNTIYLHHKDNKGIIDRKIPLNDLKSLHEIYHHALHTLCACGADINLIKQSIRDISRVFNNNTDQQSEHIGYRHYAIKVLAKHNHFDVVDQLLPFENIGYSVYCDSIKAIYRENKVWDEDKLLRCLIKHADYARRLIAENECKELQLDCSDVLEKARKLCGIINECAQFGMQIEYSAALKIMNTPGGLKAITTKALNDAIMQLTSNQLPVSTAVNLVNATQLRFFTENNNRNIETISPSDAQPKKANHM